MRCGGWRLACHFLCVTSSYAQSFYDRASALLSDVLEAARAALTLALANSAAANAMDTTDSAAATALATAAAWLTT